MQYVMFNKRQLSEQRGKISKWNVLAFAGLFLLGVATAIYMQQGRIKPVELPTLSGGQVTLPGDGLSWVNFWSISCPPCLKEMPYLEAIHRDGIEGVQIVAVNLNYDPPVDVNDYIKRENFTLPVALDLNNAALQQFTDKPVVPSHYLVDASGKILLTHLGEIDEAGIRKAIAEHL